MNFFFWILYFFSLFFFIFQFLHIYIISNTMNSFFVLLLLFFYFFKIFLDIISGYNIMWIYKQTHQKKKGGGRKWQVSKKQNVLNMKGYNHWSLPSSQLQPGRNHSHTRPTSTWHEKKIAIVEPGRKGRRFFKERIKTKNLEQTFSAQFLTVPLTHQKLTHQENTQNKTFGWNKENTNFCWSILHSWLRMIENSDKLRHRNKHQNN